MPPILNPLKIREPCTFIHSKQSKGYLIVFPSAMDAKDSQS